MLKYIKEYSQHTNGKSTGTDMDMIRIGDKSDIVIFRKNIVLYTGAQNSKKKQNLKEHHKTFLINQNKILVKTTSWYDNRNSAKKNE